MPFEPGNRENEKRVNNRGFKKGNQHALKMTDAYKTGFLDAYARTGFFTQACKEIGISLKTMYKHRKEDPDFEEALMEIKMSIDESFEAEAVRRAVHGVARPIVQGGKIVMYTRTDEDGKKIEVPLTSLEYSDRLLELLLRSRMPEKFGNKLQLEANVNTGVLLLESEAIDVEAFEVEMAAAEEKRIKQLEDESKEDE